MKQRSIPLLISLALLVSPAGRAQMRAVQHVVIDTASRTSVALPGPWELYWGELLEPGQFDGRARPAMVTLPQLWEAHQDTMQGFATYRLTVVAGQRLQNEDLAIRMPDVYSCYRLWINGIETKGNGLVGKTKETTKPYWLTRVYPFRADTDTIELVLQIANFHHSKGGIAHPIYVGPEGLTAKRFDQAKTGNTILFIALLLIAGIVGLIYFVVQEKNLSMIFYICLCLSWATRVIFSNLYLGVEWLPQLNWIWVVRLEYLSLYLTTVFGMLFIAHLFPEDVYNSLKVVYVLFGLIFTGFTLFTEPVLFTRFVQIYLSFSALLLVVIVVTIVRALINGRAGATLFLLNMIFGVFLFGYVILCYQGVFELDELVFGFGFLALFAFTGISMGIRLMRAARAHDSDMLTFEQLYGKQGQPG